MRTCKSYENTFSQFNGGYIVYWSLIFKQGPEIFASLIPQLRAQIDAKVKEGLATGVLGPIHLVLLQIMAAIVFLILVIKIIIKLPWWLFIKPLGKILFYRKKYYEATVADETEIIKYSRKLTVYLFCVIPIPLGVSKKPGKKDLEYLFKDRAESMIFAPKPKAMFI